MKKAHTITYEKYYTFVENIGLSPLVEKTMNKFDMLAYIKYRLKKGFGDIYDEGYNKDFIYELLVSSYKAGGMVYSCHLGCYLDKSKCRIIYGENLHSWKRSNTTPYIIKDVVVDFREEKLKRILRNEN